MFFDVGKVTINNHDDIPYDILADDLSSFLPFDPVAYIWLPAMTQIESDHSLLLDRKDRANLEIPATDFSSLLKVPRDTRRS